MGRSARHGRIEIYDPATNAWTTTAFLNTPRFNHIAALLPPAAGHDRVLIAGGQTAWGNAALATTEIFVYDGNGVGHMIPGPLMNDARAEFSSVTLANTQIALIGGGVDGRHRAYAGRRRRLSRAACPASAASRHAAIIPPARPAPLFVWRQIPVLCAADQRHRPRTASGAA